MQKRWQIAPPPDEALARQLAQAINVSLPLAEILVRRGITSYEEARDFFNPSLDKLHDPFLMQDMDIAVRRLQQAIDRQEKVLIYGDYDVDGTTSVALMMTALRPHLQLLDYYVPNRDTEGYGVSAAGIQWATEQGFDLIISLDCGIKAHNTISQAVEQGIDFIVCDHHTPGAELPPATAILDPQRHDCRYPYKELPGCGVGFKLLQGLYHAQGWQKDSLWVLLDLVAVAIMADMVPITGENRILCHYGLQKLNENPQPGLAALMSVAGLKPPINTGNVVFGIAPRINAAGRMEHAARVVELLTSADQEEAHLLASEINAKNEMRRDIEKDIVEQALAMIEAEQEQRVTTVLHEPTWHKGVIGIVASKCIEHHHRPTIIFTTSNGLLTGSARSVGQFDIHAALEACADLLEQFGGHKYAAGLSLHPDNWQTFRSRFEEVVAATIPQEYLTPVVYIENEIDLAVISDSFLRVIERMAPFGPGNMRPVFATRGLRHKDLRLLKDEHIKMQVVNEDGLVFEAIGFYMPHFYEKLQAIDSFDMAYVIEKNRFRDRETIQLQIKDIKFATNTTA